jgi:hypothetical protein
MMFDSGALPSAMAAEAIKNAEELMLLGHVPNVLMLVVAVFSLGIKGEASRQHSFSRLVTSCLSSFFKG